MSSDERSEMTRDTAVHLHVVDARGNAKPLSRDELQGWKRGDHRDEYLVVECNAQQYIAFVTLQRERWYHRAFAACCAWWARVRGLDVIMSTIVSDGFESSSSEGQRRE